MTENRYRPLILDASALITGFNPADVENEQYTVPLVEEELKRGLTSVRLKTSIRTGKLKVKTPKKAFLEEVEREAERVGDSFLLSEADKQVLALALELKSAGEKPIIVTDDYSIQNLARSMSIEFKPLTTFGIKFRYRWILFCSACGRIYPPRKKVRVCRVCGTPLIRKYFKKECARK